MEKNYRVTISYTNKIKKQIRKYTKINGNWEFDEISMVTDCMHNDTFLR